MLKNLQIQRANSLLYLTDDQSDDSDHSAVYPYHDEAEDLLNLIIQYGKKFSVAFDCFAGGGHSLLPVLYHGFASRGEGIDVNPRAVEIAQLNAELNNLGSIANFFCGDIFGGIPQFPKSTLYIGNPPFALTHRDADKKDLSRDGGINGLELTGCFINQALKVAKCEDLIVGVTYSRLAVTGELELDLLLSSLLTKYGTFELKILTGRKIWRNWSGQKVLSNPMRISDMEVKAPPNDENLRALYRETAKHHLSEGWDKIAYCSFAISIQE